MTEPADDPGGSGSRRVAPTEPADDPGGSGGRRVALSEPEWRWRTVDAAVRIAMPILLGAFGWQVNEWLQIRTRIDVLEQTALPRRDYERDLKDARTREDAARLVREADQRAVLSALADQRTLAAQSQEAVRGLARSTEQIVKRLERIEERLPR